MFVEGGRSFANQARHVGGMGIPQISRSCMARRRRAALTCPAYRTMWCWCAGAPSIFLAGPPLVKAAIGEAMHDDEELGGAELHGRVTGLGEYLSPRTMRRRSAYGARRSCGIKLNWDHRPASRHLRSRTMHRFMTSEELLGIVPADDRDAVRHARSHCPAGRPFGFP
jgi:geranyl-CoA carboxylase beta subunit